MNREQFEREQFEEEYQEHRMKLWEKSKSKCIKGRPRHRFRSPQTRSLTPDLTCWYCGKTVAQVQKEQKEEYCVICSYEAGTPTKLIGEKFNLSGEDLTKVLVGDTTVFEFKGHGYVCKKHAIEVQKTKIRLLDIEIHDYARKIGRCRKEIEEIEKEIAKLEEEK